MERTEGARGYYEDRTTQDPSVLNEILTATRPEDLAQQDADAAYKLPPVAPYEPHPGQPDPGFVTRNDQSTADDHVPVGAVVPGESVDGPSVQSDGSTPEGADGAPPNAASPAPDASVPAGQGDGRTLYEHVGSDAVDEAEWPVADVEAEDGSKLYYFAGDQAPGEENGASASWLVYHGVTKAPGA